MAVYIDKELCKSCAMCVSLCPKKVFEITHLVNKKGYNYAAAVRQAGMITPAQPGPMRVVPWALA